VSSGESEAGITPPAEGPSDTPAPGDDRALAALQKVSQMVAGDLDLEAVLRSSMRATETAMGAEACAILLQSPKADALDFHIVDGPKTAGLQVATVPLDDHSLAGWVARHGQPLLVPDAYVDSRFNPAYDAATGFRTRSMICTPLVVRGRRLGVIEVLNRLDGKAFDARDLALAEAVASLIAVAIHNAEEHQARLKAERLGAIGQAVAGMAHCVKNILNGLRAGCYIMDQNLARKDDAGVAGGWEIVKRNMDLLSHIVLDMLSYSRTRKPLCQPCRIGDVCQQVVDLLRPQAAERGVTLVVTGTPPDQVDVDEAGIRRCLVNLVGNAIDACSEKGEGLVEVGASAAGDDGCFTHRVKDNGVGISPEVQAQMFDPLFSTKGNKGTGLGLAVTRKIVEEHGGVVRVESAPGVGALFSLILPVKPPVPSSA